MEKVEIFEGDRATNYDNFVHQWIPGYDYVMETLPRLLHNLGADSSSGLLVAGCGTGGEIIALRDAGYDGPITGVDPSPQMMELAHQKIEHLTNIKLVSGEVKDLPLANSYGAATLILVLHFLADNGTKQALLNDLAERMKPGAPLVMVDIFGTPEELQDNLQVLKHLLPKAITEEQANERLERIKEKINYISESRLSELLVNAGFKPPTRFIHTSIYGGWYTIKATA